jgi:hypothetical protein
VACSDHARRPLASRWPGPALGLGLALVACATGCGTDAANGPLTIATDLPPPATAQLEALIGAEAIAINWIRPVPGISLSALARHSRPIDAVLTADPETLDRLAAAKRLDGPALPLGQLALGLAVQQEVFIDRAMPAPGGTDPLTDPRLLGLVAIDDPRHDAASRAWMIEPFTASPTRFPSAYAAAIERAANALPIGAAPAAALRDVIARRAGAAPAVAPVPDPLIWSPRGDALTPRLAGLRGARPDTTARLDALASLWSGSPRPAPVPAALPSPSPLLTTLLGAALVDAQPELARAWERLRRAEMPPRLVAFLVEPPPWPPASITRLQADPGRGELVDALAEHLAPNLEARFWLSESWKRPQRPVDLALLTQIEQAAGGQLLREPAFRVWLRGEWTTWARQRYRRVSRQADQPAPGSESTPTTGEGS